MTSRKRELEAGNRKQGRSMGIGEGERRGEVCGYFIIRGWAGGKEEREAKCWRRSGLAERY